MVGGAGRSVLIIKAANTWEIDCDIPMPICYNQLLVYMEATRNVNCKTANGELESLSLAEHGETHRFVGTSLGLAHQETTGRGLGCVGIKPTHIRCATPDYR